MKYILVAFFALTLIGASAQSPAKFKEIKHSFGKIKQNVPATYVFTFTNTSDKPVVVESAVAGCGCTTPEFPKAPIAKGKSGTIKVTYNAANPGKFTKEVTVKFLDAPQPIVLTIEGDVATPANGTTGTKVVVPAKKPNRVPVPDSKG
jgi:hypothetical protein